MVNAFDSEVPNAGRASGRAASRRVRPQPTVRAIRGAISVDADEPCLVWAATRELLTAMLERNALTPDDLISAMFTVTGDLTSTFPARAARQIGWGNVPMLCALEIPVPGALPRCVRVLLHAMSERPRDAVVHVYLRDAVVLRPDLADAPTPGRGDER